jgi:heme exporter protein A
MNILDLLGIDKREFSVKVDDLSKSFNSSRVFSNISFELQNSDILAVSGRNGSGKSTLLKLMCRLIVPTKGKITYTIDSKKHDGDVRDMISFISPYLNLYEEFTPYEHLEMAYRLCGNEPDMELVDYMLAIFNLYHKRNEYIKTYSSGMKQRVKYIIAISRKPHLLFLDEPFTNLDNDAVAIIDELIISQSKSNGAVIIASNDERETKHCNKFVNLSIG